jgi:acyl dehydratase
MPVNAGVVGKSHPPQTYAVGREKIREYARAVGETEPLYLDVEAARAAGHRDVVAPPMFAVVYSSAAVGPAVFDPEVGIDFAMMVHGAQEFRWGPLVVAGDEITTTVKVKDSSPGRRPRPPAGPIGSSASACSSAARESPKKRSWSRARFVRKTTEKPSSTPLRSRTGAP